MGVVVYLTSMNVVCFSRFFLDSTCFYLCCFFLDKLPLLFTYIYHHYHGYLFLLGMEMGVILLDVEGIQSIGFLF